MPERTDVYMRHLIELLLACHPQKAQLAAQQTEAARLLALENGGEDGGEDEEEDLEQQVDALLHQDAGMGRYTKARAGSAAAAAAGHPVDAPAC